MDNTTAASVIAQKVTLLDAIHWMTSTWDVLTNETIQKCFRKCGFFQEVLGLAEAEEENWDEEDYLPLIPHETSLKDYVQCDDGLATEDTISDDWESLMTEGARNSSEIC
ncbi:hypothetical protein CHS0354_026475 [Potamilus streckersoni]|uniref:Uncharacterized protein n=1 Tax=Potamilus streckersoni TaxID=2493646 RepID=A0AAE0RQ21_9BIVA|nr:hypothetical protein CHS0354_026475 [Potamilus streckersoni]